MFPVVAPDGSDWVGEAQPLPQVTLNDTSYTVVPKKLAGLYWMSSELINDSSFSIMTALGDAVKDSMGPELDNGLLYGAGGVQPIGVVALVPVVDGPSLRAAVFEAIGELGEVGGTATKVAMSATAFATEAARENSNGDPIYPNGFANIGGAEVVVVLGLADTLVYDSTRLRLIVREDLELEMSSDAGFTTDTTLVRIKCRMAAAVPVVGKAFES